MPLRTTNRLHIESLEGREVPASFTWAMQDRFADTDNDGMLDLHNLKDYIQAAPQVTFTAATEQPTTIYNWRATNADAGAKFTATGRVAKLSLPEGPYLVELASTTNKVTTTTNQFVPVNDILIVSIGDSYAAGEGNPVKRFVAGSDYNSEIPADWADEVKGNATHPGARDLRNANFAHRSTLAASAVAAKKLEDSSTKTAVTYVSVAVSGASIHDGILKRQANWADGTTGPTQSQLELLEDLVGTRTIDHLTVAVGINDVGFGKLVKDIIYPRVGMTVDQHMAKLNSDFTYAIAKLPGFYDDLKRELDSSGLKIDHIAQFEYPDPSSGPAGGWNTDSAGVLKEAFRDVGIVGVNADSREMHFVHNIVVPMLNKAVLDATKKFGWTYVGGVVNAFKGHGYGRPEDGVPQSYFQTYRGSLDWQGTEHGATHPNSTGHRTVADLLYPKLTASRDLISVSGTSAVTVTAKQSAHFQIQISPHDSDFYELRGSRLLEPYRTLMAWPIKGGGSMMTSLSLTPGTGNVQVLSTDVRTPVTIHGGSGISVGANRLMTAIRGPVTVKNANMLTLDDSADTARHVVTFNGSSVTGMSGGAVTFSGVKTIRVYAGSGNDTFSVKGNPTGVSLNGGGGTDLLDYSSLLTGVNVNLPLGMGTHFSGGISAIENVTGGAGGDTLVGLNGSNVLKGNGGRDILIGGDGADTLYGDADEDLMIAGWTSYDRSTTALNAIAGEWRSSKTRSQRINNLTQGLTVLGISGKVALNSSTVRNDAFADLLSGTTTIDWMFYDVMLDPKLRKDRLF